MQTQLADFIRNTPDGEEADAILRACVHCGFCLATCPTYQILGSELDSPRGRIYLMKQVLEGQAPTARTRLHLDRCLTCRNCETTCPSGVQYGRLLDIGRRVVERQTRRSMPERARRAALRKGLLSPRLFAAALRVGRALQPALPSRVRAKLPAAETAPAWPARPHARRMLALAGCVQPQLKPAINAAAARVLDRLGIALQQAPEAGCCGALAWHMNDEVEGLAAMRRNVDAWVQQLDAGVEAIVMTASGCGALVKEYGHHLRHDPAYAAKAARVSAATLDIAEVVQRELPRLREVLRRKPLPHPAPRLAWHAPCTLQHGQKVAGVVEELLTLAGCELVPTAESHLCCGSAGAYSLLQPEISNALKARKLENLTAGRPQVIVTANIGCLTHLQSGTELPVRHWVELLAELLG